MIAPEMLARLALDSANQVKALKIELTKLERFEAEVERLWFASVDNEDDMTSDESHHPLLNYLDEYFNIKRAEKAKQKETA